MRTIKGELMKLLLSLLAVISFTASADVTTLSTMNTSTLDNSSEQTERQTFTEDLNENTNYFEHIKAQFDSAQTPTLQQVNGWISGRCVYGTNKQKLLPSMLFVEVIPVTVGSDKDGPLFPPQIKNIHISDLLITQNTNESPDYFDELNDAEINQVSEIIQEQAESIANGILAHKITLTNSEVKVETTAKSTNITAETVNALRITKDFLVNHIVQTTTKINSETQKIEKDVQEAYCYHFKRLKN